VRATFGGLDRRRAPASSYSTCTLLQRFIQCRRQRLQRRYAVRELTGQLVAPLLRLFG
jgi:hypothetical protein